MCAAVDTPSRDTADPHYLVQCIVDHGMSVCVIPEEKKCRMCASDYNIHSFTCGLCQYTLH